MEIEHEKMEAMKALADITSQISIGREKLSELRLEMSSFLSERDRLDKLRLTKLLDESKDLIGEIKKNYQELKNYANDLKSHTAFIGETHDTIKVIIQSIANTSSEFKTFIDEEIDKVAVMKAELEIDKRQVVEDNKEIENSREEIKKDRARIESQQATLLTSTNDIKKLWKTQK